MSDPSAPTLPVAPNRVGRTLMKAAFWVVLGVFLYMLPRLPISPSYQVSRYCQVMALALAALGLNLLTGYNGQISIGHGAFFGIGAYTMAILTASHGLGHAESLVIAAVLTFIVGVVVGLPALRIRGLYLALVTLALAALFPQIVKRFGDVTGGPQGMTAPRVIAPEWSGLDNDQWRYYVILVVTAVCFVLVRNLVKSRTGRSLVAIRDSETAAEVMGINLERTKLATFGLSAMLAGVGGALSVFNDNFVDPNKYGIQLSIFILVAVVVGGTATITGSAIGAFFVVFGQVWLSELSEKLTWMKPEWSPVIFGALLILLMIVAPGGVLGLARAAWAKIRPGRDAPNREPPSQEQGEALASAV